ncbi:unnamed protein product [Moneuplotes crassus]|uniref:Uncharacterized protein n=1 Tax=Euplotes crassus TaxID=5936 RepID=A0AAD1Y0U5_EUPCR|nr:unnamed protein product [Moneuplotes crassus]
MKCQEYDTNNIFLSANESLFHHGDLDLGSEVREALNLKVMQYNGKDITKTKKFRTKNKQNRSIKNSYITKNRPQTSKNKTSDKLFVQSSKIKKSLTRSQKKRKNHKAAHLVLNIPNRIVRRQLSAKKDGWNSSTLECDLSKEKATPDKRKRKYRKQFNRAKTFLKNYKTTLKGKTRKNQNLMVAQEPRITKQYKNFKCKKNSVLGKNKLTMRNPDAKALFLV